MKKKITFGIFAAAIIAICCSAFVRPDVQSPCDAPLVGDHTGAPGETNCTGCHAGINNSGPGTVTFDVGGGITYYVPGQTYLCSVSIVQSGIDKMGYCCTSLKDSNNTAAGTFSLTMPTRTRLFTSGARNYVSHNPCGADAPTVGSNSWTFNWTAPSSSFGNITLYIGALSTNHNHATTGDNAYTTSITLTPSATSVNELEGIIENISVFPNPAPEYFTISFENLSGEQIEIAIIDIAGKQVSAPYSGKDPKGEVKKFFDIKNIAKGSYWIRISQGEKSMMKKLVII